MAKISIASKKYVFYSLTRRARMTFFLLRRALDLLTVELRRLAVGGANEVNMLLNIDTQLLL